MKRLRVVQRSLQTSVLYFKSTVSRGSILTHTKSPNTTICVLIGVMIIEPSVSSYIQMPNIWEWYFCDGYFNMIIQGYRICKCYTWIEYALIHILSLNSNDIIPNRWMHLIFFLLFISTAYTESINIFVSWAVKQE